MRRPDGGRGAGIGVPEAQCGEGGGAGVVKDGEVSEEEHIAWTKEQLAAYKSPRKVFFSDAFPLGPTGRVLKRELVAHYKE